MFKKIQNYLLLHNPLLWNIRIVPVAVITLSLHLLFFVVGYINGTVDFTATKNNYVYNIVPGIVGFFSVLTALFVFIIWLVYYLRNNAFKAIYTKKDNSLYKEWLLILLVCMLNCSYFFSFTYGSELHKRAYFSEEEFVRRTDIISMASLFADGGFEETEWYSEFVNDKEVQKHRTSYPYFGKQYPLNSLLNKTTSNFGIQDHIHDSINAARVKLWLHEGRKDSVMWLMSELDKIVKYHNLTTNVTPAKWLDKTYTPPNFTKFRIVGRIDKYEAGNIQSPHRKGYNNYDYDDVVVTETAAVADTASTDDYVVPESNDTLMVYYNLGTYDTINLIDNDVRIIDSVRYVFPKYYMPFEQLEYSYEEISEAWVRPDANATMGIILFMVSMGISTLIFSFRVTSGRNWLISVIVFGLTALVTGIVCLIFGEANIFMHDISRWADVLYFSIWVIILVVLVIMFFNKRAKKGFSAVLLNIQLWLLPWLLPAIIAIITESYSKIHRVYRYDEDFYNSEHPDSPVMVWLKQDENILLVVGICLILHIGGMYFYTRRIKQWKGIAEG